MARAMFEPVFKEIFPFWNDITESERDYICENSLAVTHKKGALIHDGEGCAGVILVRHGTLRAYLLSEEGKEVTLYRLHGGDMCMLAASCVLSSITFDVFVSAEEDCECYIIDGNAFAELCDKHKDIKIFTLETAVSRFSDVMWIMQQILFMSMDKRLAIFLLDETARTKNDKIELTHEQIARYIGSAREVVSRMLKYFANEGVVEASRGGIKIINKARLRELTL